MSEIIWPNEKNSKRGKVIEEHLSLINLEPWLFRIVRAEKQEKEEDILDICPYCNQNLQEPYWESRYSGIKARCNTCKVTWNLS